jgi:hypothetical protein
MYCDISPKMNTVLTAKQVRNAVDTGYRFVVIQFKYPGSDDYYTKPYTLSKTKDFAEALRFVKNHSDYDDIQGFKMCSTTNKKNSYVENFGGLYKEPVSSEISDASDDSGCPQSEDDDMIDSERSDSDLCRSDGDEALDRCDNMNHSLTSDLDDDVHEDDFKSNVNKKNLKNRNKKIITQEENESEEDDDDEDDEDDDEEIKSEVESESDSEKKRPSKKVRKAYKSSIGNTEVESECDSEKKSPSKKVRKTYKSSSSVARRQVNLEVESESESYKEIDHNVNGEKKNQKVGPFKSVYDDSKKKSSEQDEEKHEKKVDGDEECVDLSALAGECYYP